MAAPFLNPDPGLDRIPAAAKTEPLPQPNVPPKKRLQRKHVESHATYRITGAYWRGRRQIRQFRRQTFDLNLRAWSEEKKKHGEVLENEGVEWMKKKKPDGTMETIDLPVWPTLKTAILEEFRKNLTKVAPLVKRSFEFARQKERLKQRYFKYSCVRALASMPSPPRR